MQVKGYGYTSCLGVQKYDSVHTAIKSSTPDKVVDDQKQTSLNAERGKSDADVKVQSVIFLLS